MTEKNIKKEPLDISNKESLFSLVHGLEFKESLSDDLICGGYIATTHLDQGFYDPDKGVWVRDRVAPETLYKWADELNQGNPRANKSSVYHERVPHVSGVALKGTARVDKLPDGNYALYADTLVDKTKDNFKDTSYKLEKGLLDSFSIEFRTKDPVSGNPIPGAFVEKEAEGYIERTLLPNTDLLGYTLCSQPMNEHAVRIKEVFSQSTLKQTKEDITMSETKQKEEVQETELKEKKDAPILEQKQVLGKEQEELIQLGMEAKQRLAAEAKEKSMLEMKESLKKELMDDLSKVEVKEKVKKGNPETIPETTEFKEYKEIFDKKENPMNVEVQLKRAAAYAEKKGLFVGQEIKKTTVDIFNRNYSFECKNMSTKGNYVQGIEYKGLGITTNQNTDTDYLLSSAELNDIFDPVIYNILNQKATTWNILTKEDMSMKGNNQVQFKLKIAANSTAAAYTGNNVSLGNVTREKYQTKFKKYQVGIEVDGDMIAAARGSVGDVFQLEVMDAMEDLASVINQALYAEVGAETAAGIIGFEYITDQAGNTTLYNVTRSQANGLSSTTTGDNYINGSSADITVGNLRAAKRKALTEGSDLNNLVFFTSYVQGDKFRGIYDALQRSTPTSSRFGFEGRPEFDGIPIFEDKDCNDDDWFLVDLESHRVAVWVPPTLEMLGKDGDSQKGFIKTYFATYNRAPRRMIQIYGNATS